jgi:hypothetical protein
MSRLGHPVERWFSQTPIAAADRKHAAMMRAISLVSRWSGRPIPAPEHVPLSEALVVARWLAERCVQGRPAWMSTTASGAVRLCVAARAHGLDIAGTFFRASGEPLSPAKVRVIESQGCEVKCHYALAEAGRIGMACANPAAVDDVHVLTDKMALVERERTLAGGARVPALLLTTLHPAAPKVMLNVEVGDYGIMSRRRCGCIWERIGFTQHLHTIRSYEKLTSEGMHFVGSDLLSLVEEGLPARFGGHPTDYQFVEEEERGLPIVNLFASPRVGTLDASEVQAWVLSELGGQGSARRMMAGLWKDGGTVKVVRREPYSTSSGKVHALHVPQPLVEA